MKRTFTRRKSTFAPPGAFGTSNSQLSAFPLIDYLIATADTVGEGMRRYARYSLLTGAPMHIELREDEKPIRVLVDMECGDPSTASRWRCSTSVGRPPGCARNS